MGFFSKLGEKIDKGISWIGQQLKKFATLAADFFRRVKDGIRKFAMIIGKFFSLLAKWLDTAIKYVEATFHVIVSGVQTFLKKVGNAYQQLSYNYTRQDDGTFLKNTVIKQTFVSEDEIPADIREQALKLADGKMVDITETAAEREEEACTQLGLSA